MSAEFPVNPDSPSLSERYPNEMLPVRVISLTQGQYMIVDPEDHTKVSLHKWRAKYEHDIWYAATSVSVPGEVTYALINGKIYSRTAQKTLRVHGIITDINSDQLLIDHVNRNGLDNRRVNLRAATTSQNEMNSKKQNHTTSRFKGVCWHHRHNRWMTRIMINGNRIQIGYFEDEIGAAKAYDDAARKHFGSYARFNFPREGENAA